MLQSKSLRKGNWKVSYGDRLAKRFGVAVQIPKKRELKDALHGKVTQMFYSAAVQIPKKRELKA